MDASQYFYRNVIFSKIGNQIAIVDLYDPKNREEITDQWLSMVIQLADGQHTVNQLVQYMAKQYNGNPPESLEKTLHSVIERLVQTKFVVLTNKALELPYYLSLPYEMLDLEKAKQLHQEDQKELN